MFKPPPVPNLYEMKVAWALLRLCAGDRRFMDYYPHEQAEVITFFRYVDPELSGSDVQRARELLGEAYRGGGMRARGRAKCSGCGRRIAASEPDLVLRKDSSEKRRYYHERCKDAALRVVLNDPHLWFMTHRHVNPEAN